MNQNKKQLEILLLKYFKECYIDFPKGIVTSSESPDFIVSLNSKQQLGIELTRLNPGNLTSRLPNEIAETAIRESVIEMSREIFEHHLPHQLFVKFLFSEKQKISIGSEILLAVKTAAIIRRHAENRSRDSFFRIILNRAELPKEIENVLIVHYPGLEHSIWERSNNLGVSTNVVGDIQIAIQKKDEKLGLYQKQRLNYYWLLIFTDRLRGEKSYNLAEKVRNHRFESRFQQVFLFDLVKSDIYHLF